MKLLGIFLVAIAVVCCQDKDNDNGGNSHDDILNFNMEMFKRAEKGIAGFSSGGDIKEADMLEGDILLSPKLRNFLDRQRSGKRVSPFDASVRNVWPGARVPFKYNRLSPKFQKYVDAAIEEYNKKTCIKWVPKKASDRSYVEFYPGGGCFSMIGRVGGRQYISLGRRCNTKGIAIHEMMHALGFFHEQSRMDRDKHIRIIWENIPGNVRYNFEKYKHGQADTLGAPYDKKSIMHYGNTAFSVNRGNTIESISNPKEVLGQRTGLSAIDALQLNRMYKCKNHVKPLVKPKEPCVDKYTYFCPILAKERYCDVSVSVWVKENCKKSCDNCPVPEPENPVELPTCQEFNNREDNCVHWNKQGFCTTTNYVIFMGKTCFQCGNCRN